MNNIIDDKEQKKIFCKNLNRLLRECNEPQNVIAEKIGVSPQAFNTWVKGKAFPKMWKVQALADYFGVDKSELIDEEQTTKLAKIKFIDNNFVIEFEKGLTEENVERLKAYYELLLKTQKG